MIDAPLVLDWLRLLGAAVSAQQLYGAGHRHAADAVAMLETASRELVADGGRTALGSVDGRLTCNGETIAGGSAAGARMFGALTACGYDQLALLPGVTIEELQGLVSAMAGVKRDAAGLAAPRLESTPHLRFSAIETNGVEQQLAAIAALIGPNTVEDVWSGIERSRTLDREALDRVLAPLESILGGSGSQLLPLSLLESHDQYTAIHIGNVAVLTMALAEAMGLAPRAAREVGIAALLHDIGKVKVPETILNADRRLTGEELSLMRKHPEIGACMLMETPGTPPLAAIVAFEHHLQANGGGYPAVPAGWRVNPASAMTQAADVYDALRTHRPYRAALDDSTVADLMMRDRGTVFNADILDVFFERVVPRVRKVPPARPA